MDDGAADGDAADGDDIGATKPMASAFMVDVGRSGVLFSTQVGVETIAKMLELRATEPDSAQHVVMPLEVQKSLQLKAMEMWLKEHPEIKRRLSDKCSNKTQHARTARMVFRRHCFKMFGGIEWMYLILAVGDLNDKLVSCANKASTELVEARKRKLGDAYRDNEAWMPAAAQRRKDREASASSAGPQFHAVVHKPAASKEMRSRGRKLDKRIEREEEAWAAGRSQMNGYTWRRLKEEADRVWAEAHEASEALGVEYQARDGTMRCKRSQDDTWVGRTLTYYENAIRDDPAKLNDGMKVAPLRG